MKLLLVALLALCTLAPAAFVPPAEGPVPFRRDKLPLDVDTMMGLSRQLVILSSAMDLESPAEVRSAAQMLAVAVALDPANREGRELTESLAAGGAVPTADAKKVGVAKNRTWHLIGWLGEPEAGADGNDLAACLTDIMKAADPEHPRAREIVDQAEQGKWKGWVSSVDAFRDKAPEIAENTDPGDETPMPDVSPKEDGDKALKLTSASVRLPLWHADRVSKKLVVRPVMLTVSAKVEGENPKIDVQLPGDGLKSMRKPMGKGLEALLVARHGSIPKGLRLEFALPSGIDYDPKLNGRILTGAAMVLADAVLTGSEPTGIVFAEIDADGTLSPPARCWKFLRIMADQTPGYRLVLPEGASKFLPSLITLDDTEFFITHEVLLAKGVDQLLELSSASPPEAVVAAHQAFDEIRKARGTRSLGGFLSHSSTQQRLKAVVELLPEHASARMLALRGTSKWPKRLPRGVYAREIRSAVEPVGREFNKGGWMTLNVDTLETTADTCRRELEEVERLFGSVADRQELHAPAMLVAKLLKGLAVDAKRSNAFDEGRSRLEASFKETWREYATTIELLTDAAGDREDYPLPAKDRFK